MGMNGNKMGLSENEWQQDRVKCMINANKMEEDGAKWEGMAIT